MQGRTRRIWALRVALIAAAQTSSPPSRTATTTAAPAAEAPRPSAAPARGPQVPPSKQCPCPGWTCSRCQTGRRRRSSSSMPPARRTWPRDRQGTLLLLITVMTREEVKREGFKKNRWRKKGVCRAFLSREQQQRASIFFSFSSGLRCCSFARSHINRECCCSCCYLDIVCALYCR